MILSVGPATAVSTARASSSIRGVLTALALLAFAGPTLAQPVAIGTEKVQITADNFTLNEGNRQAVFEGNVVVTHPSVTVNAPKVVVVYGEKGTSDIESFEASGNVKLITKDQEATGERAVFDPVAQTMRLSGNVVVAGAASTVKSAELVVNLATNTSVFSSGKSGGRVTGVFNAQ